MVQMLGNIRSLIFVTTMEIAGIKTTCSWHGAF